MANSDDDFCAGFGFGLFGLLILCAVTWLFVCIGYWWAEGNLRETGRTANIKRSEVHAHKLKAEKEDSLDLGDHP